MQKKKKWFYILVGMIVILCIIYIVLSFWIFRVIQKDNQNSTVDSPKINQMLKHIMPQLNYQDNIEIKGQTLKYVSRGGLKLEKAISLFEISLKDKICADIGASTGGFTDCMLQNGAQKVYAIDVGHSQLAEELLNNEKVVNLEGTNIK